MKYKNRTWTNEMVEDLKSLHKKKLSARQIADKLNAKYGTVLTRSAVIGKRFRLEPRPIRPACYSKENMRAA